jgi:hypothetical protein
MREFFSQIQGDSIPWFGITHILLLVGFLFSLILIWILGPKLKNTKAEPWLRYALVALTVLFEFRVFEDRILNGSIFRIPLCGIALYGLTYAMAFKHEKAYKIFYFYAFGTLLTYLFYDTVWGLDRWNGWTYFGAHAAIGWFAIYGYRVLNFVPSMKDLYRSIAVLAVYAFISGYATLRFGGSDELFLFHAPADFMNVFIDIHPLFYLGIFIILAAILLHLMYLPVHLTERSYEKKNSTSPHSNPSVIQES